MQWYSVVAIYVIVWVLCGFLVLPFGIETHDEGGPDKVPGQADGAPAHFRPGRVALRATILSAIVTTLFVANYVFGWISKDDINLFGKPPQAAEILSGN